MEADRHAQALRFLVEREEVRVSRPSTRFPVSLLHHAASTVVLGESKFLYGLVHGHRRRQAHPAQAPARLGTAVRQPTVVATAEGKGDLRAFGTFHDKKGGIDDLHLGSSLVHGAQARLNVQKLARLNCRPGSVIVADKSYLPLAVDQPVAARAPGGIQLGWVSGRWLELDLLLTHVLPSIFGFIHVGVGVDDQHVSTSLFYRQLNHRATLAVHRVSRSLISPSAYLIFWEDIIRWKRYVNKVGLPGWSACLRVCAKRLLM